MSNRLKSLSASIIGGLGWGANVNQQREDVLNGNVSHNADISAMILAADSKEMYDTVNLYSSGTSGMGGVIGEMAGVGLGIATPFIAAKYGAMIGLPGGIPGMLIGGAAGLAVGTAAAFAGQMVGSGSLFGGSPYTKTLQGTQARQYLEVARAMRGNNSIEAGKAVLKTGKLSESATFRALTSGQMNRGAMNVEDSSKFSENIADIVKETGMSVSDVVSGVKAAGVDGTLASAFAGINKTGPGEDVAKDIRAFVGEATTTNFMISENAAALQEFVTASSGRYSDEATINNRYVNAVAGLKGVGVTSEGIESIYRKVAGMRPDRVRAFAARLGDTAKYGASRQIRDITTGVLGYAEDLVSGERGDEKEGLSKELESVRTRMETGASTSEILDTLTTRNSRLGDFLSRKSKLIGSVSGLTAEDLTRRTAKDLADTYGMDKSVFATVKQQIDDGTYSHDQGVRAVKLQALTQEVSKANGEDQSSETRAIIATFKAARDAMEAAKVAFQHIAK
jgi:hypothetical protein